jgi:hypothetical protein
VLRRACSAALLVAATAFALPLAQAAPALASTATNRYVPLAPVRLLDTRPGGPTVDGLDSGSGKLGTASTIEVDVVGRAGIPGEATSVALNVTAIDASWGYVQVFPTGIGAVGTSSNLNIERPGQIVANLAVVPIGHGGRVTIYTQGPAHFAVDALGYFVPATTSAAGRYVTQDPAPQRVMDTRSSTAGGAGIIENPGDSMNCGDFATWAEANVWFWKYREAGFGDVANLDSNGDGIPCEGLRGAPAVPTKPLAGELFRLKRGEVRRLAVGQPGSAVVLSVIGTVTTADGYIQVYPTGGPTGAGASSNLNLRAGETRTNLVIVPVGADGTVSFFHQAGGHLVVDRLGSFTTQSAAADDAGLFVALTPGRLLDTRAGAKPGAGSRTRLHPLGSAGLPVDGVAAVMLNVTGTEADEPGYVAVLPDGALAGLTSTLNIQAAGQTVANAAIGDLGPAQGLDLYAFRAVHIVLDTSGYFVDGS